MSKRDVALNDLIADLGADLRPVKRLRPPVSRALGWLGIVAALALALAAFADLAEIAGRLRMVPDMWLAVLGSTLTAVLGAFAVFQLSLPDRRGAWALLPLPGLALWVGASGMGCLRDWFLPHTHPASMVDGQDCFVFIVGLSIPLSVLMVAMVRRACPLRPNLTAATGGLAVAAAAASLLTFFHPYDAGATDLAVHTVAVLLVVGLNRWLGGRLLAPAIDRTRVSPR